MELESNPSKKQDYSELEAKAMAICDMLGLSSENKQFVRENPEVMEDVVDNPTNFNDNVITSIRIMSETA